VLRLAISGKHEFPNDLRIRFRSENVSDHREGLCNGFAADRRTPPRGHRAIAAGLTRDFLKQLTFG
jgi:hypothetical protein